MGQFVRFHLRAGRYIRIYLSCDGSLRNHRLMPQKLLQHGRCSCGGSARQKVGSTWICLTHMAVVEPC